MLKNKKYFSFFYFVLLKSKKSCVILRRKNFKEGKIMELANIVRVNERSEEELDIIKFVKTYEYFMSEISEYSAKVNSRYFYPVGRDYDENVNHLYNAMKGLSMGVGLYGRKIGIKSTFSHRNNLVDDINFIFEDKEINSFVQRYRGVISNNGTTEAKYMQELQEKIDNVQNGKFAINETHKGFPLRIIAIIGSTVNNVYKTRDFKLDTCAVMTTKPQNTKAIKNMFLPSTIREDIDRLNLSSTTPQVPVSACIHGDNKSVDGR